jgi:DNA polymerase I
MTKPHPLVLIDGSGFIFRAYHALPPLTRPGDGTPVGAVYGFCSMLHKFISQFPHAPIIVIFDVSRKSFRTELYPEYKAHRPPAPEDLIPQFPIIREAVRAFGLPAVELENYEADDLIASYTRAALEAGREVDVVSSDKDLMQLLRPGVRLLDPLKNKEIGLTEVAEKFGVTPDKVGDVLALMGDSSDNVPGAPGIGPKTAAELITTYGDLETLLVRAGEIKQPKRRESIVNNTEIIRLSRKLVALDEQTPLPMALDELPAPHPDKSILLEFLLQQGFRSLVTKIEKDIGVSASQSITLKPVATVTAPPTGAASLDAPYTDYVCVQEIAQLTPFIAAARASGVLAVDTETDSLTPSTAKLVGISLATAPGRACYIPLGHVSAASGELMLGGDVPKQLSYTEVFAQLKDILEDPAILKIGQNIKFDLQVFAQHGVTVAPFDDTMLLSYALDNGLHGHGMDELSEKFLAHKTILFSEVCGTGKNQITFDQVPLDKATAYAAEDADVTYRLWQYFKPRLLPERRVSLYETIERPFVPVIAQMERDGVLVDASVLRGLSQSFANKMEALQQEIIALAGIEFNVGSPKQLGEVLFDKLALPGGTKGKAGAYTTDADVLEELASAGHEIAQKVLDWRGYSKLRSTYTEALPASINARTGRVHTAYSLAGTSTGRLSSSDPNLQNIPIRTEDGRSIRRAFIAPPGHKLLSIDYSQIELRLLAHMANIPALKDAFIHGIDIHAKTASEVFGVPLPEMTPELRRRAKAINFGIIYGISAFGLARQLGIAQGEAAAFIKIYFERFPELKTYMDTTKEFCKANGFVETLFGRICHIPSIREKNPARRSFAERQAINAPLQGTAADIIKRAMIRIPSALKDAGLKARMLLQVHDELLFEVPDAEVEATSKLVKQIMESAAQLSVPLIAEAGVADNWAQAH